MGKVNLSRISINSFCTDSPIGTPRKLIATSHNLGVYPQPPPHIRSLL